MSTRVTGPLSPAAAEALCNAFASLPDDEYYEAAKVVPLGEIRYVDINGGFAQGGTTLSVCGGQPMHIPPSPGDVKKPGMACCPEIVRRSFPPVNGGPFLTLFRNKNGLFAALLGDPMVGTCPFCGFKYPKRIGD